MAELTVHMSTKINIDRFTRLGESISGSITPAKLPRLVDYLADQAGEIHYSFSGEQRVDATGSQKRQVKCIIYGWFSLAHPITLDVERYELSVSSTLVIVATEAELPSLEAEPADEDYIVCGAEMDWFERLEEEILLDIPVAYTPGASVSANAQGGKQAKRANPAASPAVPAASNKVSPFAKLAVLKNK